MCLGIGYRNSTRQPHSNRWNLCLVLGPRPNIHFLFPCLPLSLDCAFTFYIIYLCILRRDGLRTVVWHLSFMLLVLEGAPLLFWYGRATDTSWYGC